MKYDKITVEITDRYGTVVIFFVDGQERRYQNPAQWLLIEMVYQSTEDHEENEHETSK